jgi:hypothetical protein
MRALVMDDEAQRKVDTVVAYAMSHPFSPAKDSDPRKAPGNNPQLTVHLNSYRCVFSFSFIEGNLFRHLTISVPQDAGKPGAYPSPEATSMIAGMFGFTNSDAGMLANVLAGRWQAAPNKEDVCVVLLERANASK